METTLKQGDKKVYFYHYETLPTCAKCGKKKERQSVSFVQRDPKRVKERVGLDLADIWFLNTKLLMSFGRNFIW